MRPAVADPKPEWQSFEFTRGRLDTTLVLWVFEFGRTPLGENRPSFPTVTGRDHHPFAFSLRMAGGGITVELAHPMSPRPPHDEPRLVVQRVPPRLYSWSEVLD